MCDGFQIYYYLREEHIAVIAYGLLAVWRRSKAKEPIENLAKFAWLKYSKSEPNKYATSAIDDQIYMIMVAKESFNIVMNGAGELKELVKSAKSEKASELGIIILDTPTALTPLDLPLKGSVPPPMAPKKGGAPPPPPPPLLAAGRLLQRKQSIGKLKKSSLMINLFKDLKTKLEGSRLPVEPSTRTKKQFGGSPGGKEGMAASLQELTKRSPYFKQIEEDVQKHAKTILQLKVAINCFQTKDMVKLIKFRQNIEAILEVLTDETQVLAKFEDFPIKKLETIRAASALYSKSNLIVFNLKKWDLTAPAAQLLNKFDCYFSKVKEEMDAFERIKDEESRHFKSHGVDFDFNIFITIKELMVDVSSNCMERVLKEWRETKAAKCKTDAQKKANANANTNKNLLWKAFQLAFRVYSFAGGNDDRADKLAGDLGNEILYDSSNHNFQSSNQ